MLIYWGIDAYDEATRRDSKKFLEITSEILRARRKGFQFIVIEPDLCDELLNLPLSDREKYIVRKLRDEYTQTGASIESFRPAIVIKSSAIDAISDLHGIFNVPFKLLEEVRVLEQSSFVLENEERDGFLMDIALETLRTHPVNYVKVHGGGADILSVFESQLKRKGIVACSVDSDKYTPLSLKNEKLSGLKTRIAREKWILSFPFSPRCREIENMLPPAVIFKLPSARANASTSKIDEIIEKQNGEYEQCFWNYFDIKEGVSHGKVSKLCGDEHKWVSEKLSLAGISLLPGDSPDLGEGGNKYKYLDGFGDRVVDQIKRDKSLHNELVAYMKHPRWQLAFLDVIKSLCLIFSSSYPMDADA